MRNYLNLVLMLLVPAIITAQTPQDSLARQTRGANNGIGADVNPISIEAGQADGKGEIVIRLPNAEPTLKHVLKLSAPTDKDSQITDFTNLDGLAKDFNAGYSFRKLTARKDKLDNMMEKYDNFILSHQSLEGVNELESLNKVISNLPQEDQNEWKEILSKARDLSSSWFVDGKLSYNKYEFFDQTGEAQESNEMGLSLKGGYSRPLGSGRITGAVGFQRAIKDSETNVQICTAVQNNESFESCKELPLGEPEELEGAIGHLEYRVPIEIFKRKIVLSPMLSYDDAQDAWGIQLPIYLVRTKGVFSGGFRVGWRSDKERIVASVFVSKPLDFQ
jgi:hypothetical protein